MNVSLLEIDVFEALKEKGVIKRIGGTRGIGVINLKEK
jgi:hypothetical protein